MNRYREISSSLLSWYDRCARDLPWRGIHDAYRTWISEIMLQQTRVDTVIPYYRRFLARFPSLPDLAAGDEAEVLKLWEGLGYYSRARNLLKGARQVAEEYSGKLPEDPQLLAKISGIGPYTAGAIASIAYDIPVPAVDGNVLRVYSRVFGIRKNIRLPAERSKLDKLAEVLVPQDRPGDYNQAVMDLGATVCIPGTPNCDQCPLSDFCNAFERGDAADLPLVPGKPAPKIIQWTVAVITDGKRTLVRQRTESLLQGLWCFPMLECSSEETPLMVARKFHLAAEPIGNSIHARHVFTHLVWEMDVLPLRTAAGKKVPAGYRWVSTDELNALAFPAAMNAALRTAKELLREEEL